MSETHPSNEAAIAVVGLSCRLPMAANPREFWELLTRGKSAITEPPPGRWTSGQPADGTGPATDATAARWGGFLERIDAFDAEFFGISPREAQAMDPQQRLALELGWEALEDAGQLPAALRATKTGVFVGAIWDDYALLQDRQGAPGGNPHALTGRSRGIIANRLSYVLGTRGPSLTVDSGQSSSLVAVHLACASLRSGEATLAIAGGVNLNLIDRGADFDRIGALAPDGRCRTFDAAAAGFVRGEGGGMVVLKPLERALADGDRIYCVIRGGAVNHDGPGTALAAPSADGQRAVLESAYRSAGVDPRQVGYVELHGTGTRVGDPVEAAALGAVLGAARTAQDAPLLVGSAKTNVGHLEGAAGVVGLLKVALSLSHGTVPASLNFTEPHPRIDFDGWHLKVATSNTPWPTHPADEAPATHESATPDTATQPAVSDQPGRAQSQAVAQFAGVSSFGIGGTNCHLVLAAAPGAAGSGAASGGGAAAGTAAGGSAAPGSGEPTQAPTGEQPQASPAGPLPWVVSAPTAAGLAAQAARLAAHLTADAEAAPADVGSALLTTRTVFAHRAVVLGERRADLLAGLDALGRGDEAPQVIRGRARAGKVAFVFPGQGGQWEGMARELWDQSVVFRESVEACAAAFAPYLDWSLLDVVRGAPDAPSLVRVDVVQPVLFAQMVALAAVWRSLGVVPDAVVGHSQGEIAAAHVCGALSLADAARIVAVRSRAVATLGDDAGAMASILLPAASVDADLAEYAGRIHVAAVNGPHHTVVGGDRAAVLELVAGYEARGVRARAMPVSYASHTDQVEPVRGELLEALADVRPSPAAVPFFSTVTGEPLDTTGLDTDYWYRNLRHTVRFEPAVRALAAAGHTLFVEVSPHPVLTLSVEQIVTDTGEAIGTLRRDQGGWQRMVFAAAQAYASGAPVDWSPWTDRRRARRVSLPTYAFQRRRHWLDAATPGGGSGTRSGPADAPAVTETTPATTSTPAADPIPTGPAPSDPTPQPTLDVTAVVLGATAAALGHLRADAFDPTRTFKELGLDSVTGAELAARLSSATGLPLPDSLTFDCPTPQHVIARLQTAIDPPADGRQPASDPAARQETGRPAATDEPIAVVAMACRYPGGVHSPQELWELVHAGGEGTTDFPTDRGWDLDGLYHPDPEHAGTSYTRRGCFLDDVARFDAAFFGISPREAEAMEPQQRLLLEVAWEAVERGGLDPRTLRGSQVGVFVGAMAQDYGPRMHQPPAGTDGGFLLTGSTASVISGRVAYALGLEGPAVTVDTACSSSLVALHLAAGSLRAGECSMALAGGVTVLSLPGIFVEFSRQRGLAPDGRCKAFADGADGTGWGEGAGLVLLERLSDAQRNGHRVLAVLRGSAINQDGASNGLTAPNGPSQQRVIQAALTASGVAASEVDVVEAHGTGTSLGDPIEAQALLATYGQGRGAGDPLWLGSVKSNIGHTQAAAGVAGVIKMVEAIRRGVVPRTLHVDAPSSRVDWTSGAVELATRERAWPVLDRPRRAAVSSFGISGTNAHLVLEQAPAEDAQATDDTPTLPAGPTHQDRTAEDERTAGRPLAWLVSGHDAPALAAQAARLAHWAQQAEPATAPTAAEVARALATSRTHHTHRAVVTAQDTAGAIDGLTALAAGNPAPGTVTGTAAGTPKTVFVFPGQGPQWAGMASDLLAASPEFAAELDACAQALEPHTDWHLLDVLRQRPGAPGLDRVDVVQPALFAVASGLVALWRAHGVHPDAVIGHSQGEIAAAYACGALGLEDAARVSALRSKALADVAGTGGMASLPIAADRARDLLTRHPGVHLAALNGPATTVVAGDADALTELVAHCQATGIDAKTIPVDYASHTPHMQVLRDTLHTLLADLTPRPAQVPFYSTVTGDSLDTTALDGTYWYDNLSRPVLFHPTLTHLVDTGHRLFVETSPHPVLTASIQDVLHPDGDPEPGSAAIGTLRRDAGGWPQFLTALATGHVHGAPVDWPRALGRPTGPGHPVDLPSYAFQGDRHWLGPAPTLADASGLGLHPADHPLLASTTWLPDGSWHATATLGTGDQPWLAEHAVTHTPLLPGTAHLDLALAAGTATGCPNLAELTLHAPLLLADGRPVHLHLTVGTPERTEDGDAAGEQRRSVHIHSRPQGTDADQPWTHHASGILTTAGAAPTPPATPAPWPPAGATAVPLDGAYEDLAARGHQYGPAFQNLHALWRTDDALYADVRLAPTTVTSGFGLHPALLDAALHPLLIATGFGPGGTEGQALPFVWSGVTLHATDATALRVRITTSAATDAGADAVHVSATDPAGGPVLTVDALTLRPLAPMGLTPTPDTGRSLLHLDWHPVEPDTAAPTSADTATRLAVLGADDRGLAATLARHTGRAVTRHTRLVDLGAALEAAAEPAPDVVLALLPAPDPGQDPARAAAHRTETTLGLLQEWLASPHYAASRLAVVTEGAVAASEATAATADGLADAALWGLVRSAQAEEPDRFLLIDLDHQEASVRALPAALDLALSRGETQLALHSGEMSVPRLVPAAADTLTPPADGADWQLEVAGDGGTLGQVVLAPADASHRPLEPHQVRMTVRAVGLNFRDVMVSLGLVPVKVPIGGEDAGTVTEVGAAVTELAPGDRVMGMAAAGGIGPTRIIDHRLLTRIPDTWSYTDAATVPAAFLTAYYSLVELAGIRAGDTVLVHTATGGVGMAAIQLARHFGAEVFATASPPKWDTLRALGLDDAHIASSRTLDFETHFRAGAPDGVDIVLNSLTAGSIDASLRLLAPGGRFIEMGKTDIRDADQVAAAHPHVHYRAFDLLDVDPDTTRAMLAALAPLFAAGTLRPLPATTWPLSRARQALRHFSLARHTGKITLALPPTLDPAGTVLITGGTGTLGTLVARHLVARHGIRHLLLLSRSGPNAPGAHELQAELAELGAVATIAACDTADPAALADQLATVPAAHPLTAVIHAAGALHDGTVDNLTPQHLDTVFRPKADAAWNLHRATLGQELAAFVLFSSATATLGSAGQANYAAANAFLDALSHHRRARHLPATSLAWGLWEEASGMTGHLDQAQRGRVVSHAGLTPIGTAHGLALLDTALRIDRATLAPCPLTPPADPAALPAVLRALPGAGTRRAVASGATDSGLAATLATLTPDDQHRHLLDLVRAHAATVLGHPTPDGIVANRPFKEIGFDSLTAVELRNRLNTATRMRLSPTLIFDHPTPTDLATHLHTRLSPQDADPAQRVQRELERLEASLADLTLEPATSAALRARLEGLAWKLGGGERPTVGAAGSDEDLTAATDDEIFDVIENELGLS
ncbi:SDR family NAD(P)-dependent oxidoreductase [Streptomyces sp. 796.1]|uniref:SDR family NAD(P)-dependent oxidoreductase n=1 Tax=Streptomyces sp. 796.1 TaxID=3163029 RepID=UPI0039C943F8